MKTITNNSKGRHQVKTLDQGLVFIDPGQSLTAHFEPTYARLIDKGMALDIENAPEDALPGLSGPEGAEGRSTQTEQRQNGSNGGSEGEAEPTDRDGWVKLAEAANIDVKKSWGINRIKAELEKVK